jgi:hypothetical protein
MLSVIDKTLCLRHETGRFLLMFLKKCTSRTSCIIQKLKPYVHFPYAGHLGGSLLSND